MVAAVPVAKVKVSAWKLVVFVKVLLPEKVLLFASKVEEAAVIAELHPKAPLM